MGYQIEYAMDKISVIRRNIKSELFTGVVFVALLVVGTISVQYCSGLIQKACLDQGDHVRAAAEQLVDDLRNGMEVKDAVQTFCAEFTQ